MDALNEAIHCANILEKVKSILDRIEYPEVFIGGGRGKRGRRAAFERIKRE